MTQTLVTTFTTSVLNGKTGPVQNNNGVQSLLTSNAGSTLPAYATNGTIWLDDSASEEVFKVYADLKGTGAATYEMGQIHRSKIEMLGAAATDRAIEGLALQQRASISAGAADVAHLFYRTTDERLRYIRDDSSSYTECVLSSWDSSEFFARPINTWREVGSPTMTEKGDAVGPLMDATSKKLGVEVFVPAGVAGSVDAKLRFRTALNQAETASDTENWTLTYNFFTPSNGESVLDTPATYRGTATNSGTATLSDVDDGDVTEHEITIPAAAFAGKTRGLLKLVRTDVSTVGGVVFLGAEMLWPAGSRMTE